MSGEAVAMTPTVVTGELTDSTRRTFVLDGVRVHHFPSGDTVCRATLVFAVGDRYETLPTTGVLHALEHLVMDTVRSLPIEVNASVGRSTTEFVASGSPARVREYLERICRALGDPPVGTLAKEAKVLAAEMMDGGSPAGLLHVARYGRRDLGLVDGPGPGPEGLRPETVRAMAERWFGAPNAVLIVDGPWPAGLRLPLADTCPPDRPVVPVRSWDRPHALTVDGPACLASLTLPAQDASRIDAIAKELIDTRLQDVLRHRAGHSYVVDSYVLLRTDGREDLIVFAEPPAGRIGEAVEALVVGLRGLLVDGPNVAEVSSARDRVHENLHGRDAALDDAYSEALNRLHGLEHHRPDPDRLAAITVTEVAGYLRRLSNDILFLVDEFATDVLDRLQIPVTTIAPTLPSLPPGGRTFTPGLVNLVLSADARRSRVTLYDWGLGCAYGDEIQAIGWPEVAGVMAVEDDDLVVFGLDGAVIPVGPGLYRGGRALLDAVRRHVPEELFYAQSELLAELD